jgi:hypothetical protein
MSADSSRLPGNSYRTRSIEMPTPNTRLIATALSATTRVIRSAWVTTGSFTACSIATVPSANVFWATSHTGHATRRKR